MMNTSPGSTTGIDPAELARLRERIGSRVQVRSEPYLTEANGDAARHWADALGDANPLWRDADYARHWGYRDALAPPTILYAFSRLSIGYRGGLPGVHSFFAGTNWTWHRPILQGSRISAEVDFTDLVEHSSSFAGVSYQQISEVRYRDSDSQSIADAQVWGMRVSRSSAQDRSGSRPVEIASYTDAEIETIMQEYAAEQVRTDPRDTSPLAVGQQIPTIVRGPYTATTAVAFEQAWGGLFIKAHGPWYDYLRRHPAAGLRNLQNVPEPPEAVHWDRDFAQRAGLPEAYDYGPERLAWIGVLLTNWMGPTGFLRRLDVQVRRFNLVGDLTHCHGRIARVDRLDSETVVGLDVWAQNQRQERTALGTAEVVIRQPARSNP